MSDWLLPLAVLAVAILYASAGHAGATGYIAVMGLVGLAPEVIRPTALVLNLVVAAIGTVQFARAGHFRRGLFLPLGLASVPAAAVGGAWSLPTSVFEGVLGLVLAGSALRIVLEALWSRAAAGTAGEEPAALRRLSLPLLAAVGAGLGLASGLTGTGGGVFLTPLLLALRVATTRQVAAVSIVFILVNSAAGLGGWLASGRSLAVIDPSVVAAAAVGGLVGSQAGAFQLPVRRLRLVMALVLAVASVKLLGAAVAAVARPAAGVRSGDPTHLPPRPGDVPHPPLRPGQPLLPAAGVKRKVPPRVPLVRPPGLVGERLEVSGMSEQREDALVVAMAPEPRVLATGRRGVVHE
jgi:uncharacterized membrane protein YfcA